MELGRTVSFSTGNFRKKTETKIRKHNIAWKQKTLMTLFLLLFILLGILITPVFNIKEIEVRGNSYIQTDKILEISPARINKNIFLFGANDAESKIGELSFVDTVTVERIFPSKVSITIKECNPIAQIMCGQSLYLVVDKNGKILDTASVKDKYAVPVISKMNIMEFEVAKPVEAENSQELKNALMLLQELYQNGLIKKTSEVFTDGNDAHAVFTGDIRCNFGSGDNLSYRVKFVKECLPKIPEGESGEIRFMEDYKAVFTKDEKEIMAE